MYVCMYIYIRIYIYTYIYILVCRMYDTDDQPVNLGAPRGTRLTVGMLLGEAKVWLNGVKLSGVF